MKTNERQKVLQRRLIILAIVLAVIAAIIGSLSTFWTEFEWFRAIGFDSVYVTQLLSQLGTGVVFGAVALVVFAVHVSAIKRNSKPRKDWTIPTPEGDIDLREIVSKVGTPVVVTAALTLAVVMGYWASRHWEEVLRFFNQTSFGKAEPILGKDIGFYLFTLPAMQFTQEWMVYLSGGAMVFSAAIYFLRGEIVVREDRRWPEMSASVRSHLLVSAAIVVGVIAWGFRIEMFEALFSKRGVAYGATYSDVYASLWAFRIMIGVCGAVALFLLYAVRAPWKGNHREVKYPAYALASLVVLYAVGIFGWPTIVQRFVVAPNELVKESEFLRHAIDYTRDAYGLDVIREQSFASDNQLRTSDLKKNQHTIDNIKIWDHRPMRATYQQLQNIRTYYDFPNISVDRYRIGDNYWQVMLSARELVHDQLPAQSRTWTNQHLQYTHGYGVCLSPVNQTGPEGLPSLWVKDIPPVSRHPDLKVTKPAIYYGLATNSYALVKTRAQEFDYPKGKDSKVGSEENVYTTYSGKGGVAIGSLFRRLLFALRFGDVNLLVTGQFTDESRILFNRNIQERIRTVAPFLMLDQEPYITIIDGRLKWIQDAYTISYRYPYSQPTALGGRRRINYIRNSVKIVVDAYDGDLAFYIWDSKDPMIQTYARIFPKLFTDKAKASESLRRHVRYPKDLFTIQAVTYESFHMTDVRLWYSQEDKWAIAKELAEKVGAAAQAADARRSPLGRMGGSRVVDAAAITGDPERMHPYYMIMRLPREQREEFLVMVPFTPRNRKNMVAWMTGRCDGENYGKLLVYTFPKQKLIFGPMQVEARINQNEEISKWITLRNQMGSKVLRGDLLVIPIEESILYVEPIYLQAEQTKLPELKQVIVAFDQKVAMRPTLEAALAAVFGVDLGSAAVVSPPPSGGIVVRHVPEVGSALQLVAKAREAYRSAEEKLKAGDWAGYGAEQARLKRVLEELAKRLGAQMTTSAPAAAAPAAAPPRPAGAPKPAALPVPKPNKTPPAPRR